MDITLVELADMLRSKHGALFAPSTIWRFFDRHSMTVKTRPTPASRNGPTFSRGDAHGSRPSLISIPNGWCSSMRLRPARQRKWRLRGRARRGVRCRPPIPHGHWKTTTFTGTLRLTGMTAPMVLDGPMTGEWFAAYAEQVLAPTLRPGDIVILDNLPAHKTVVARDAIEATGACMLFLPACRPRWLGESGVDRESPPDAAP